MPDKAHILIAEDDPNFGIVLRSYLALHAYRVTLCENGNEAWQAFQREAFDLCILDVMMPDRDGFSLAADIRDSGRRVPFVFLTAKSLKEDQVRGYRLGAIDYLVKPFDPDILLLKVEALLGRSRAGSDAPLRFELGHYVFDYETRELRLDDAVQRLSPKEADLLLLLCERKGEVLTREEALLKIWQEDSYFTAQSMNVFITKLRKYLGQDPRRPIEIVNLHGKGFILKD